MPKINWKTGDRFQILSTLGAAGSLDVELYGVFVKSGLLTIAKINQLSTREINQGMQREICAREDFTGTWGIFHHKATTKDGFPDAVPINTDTQWVPAEVGRIFLALHLAENGPKEQDLD